jgi:hypothetical protein
VQVYGYLETTAAGQQTRENIVAFFKATEQYKLTKAEQLQASNLRPASAVEVHLVRCLALLCGCSSSGFDISLFIMCNMNMHYATLHLSLSGQVGCDVFVATGHC